MNLNLPTPAGLGPAGNQRSNAVETYLSKRTVIIHTPHTHPRLRLTYPHTAFSLPAMLCNMYLTSICI